MRRLELVVVKWYAKVGYNRYNLHVFQGIEVGWKWCLSGVNIKWLLTQSKHHDQ